MNEDWVVEAIGAIEPESISRKGLRCSAVLMLLRPTGTGPTDFDVVFTRRSAEVATHAGQVSFPGGRMEGGETPLEAALRETQEELGIPTDGIPIVGELHPLVTNSGFHVTPFVARLVGEVKYEPDSREVARVFQVPLVALLEPSAWEMHEYSYKSKTVPIWYFHYDGEVIWGVTGSIVRRLMEYLWEVEPAL